jgi:hypothetical protein
MSAYTSSLGLEEITPGSQAGLWGNTTNNNLILIDQAVTGVTPLSFAGASGSTKVLDGAVGALNEARSAVLNITGSASGPNTVVIPNVQKTYLVRNFTGQNITFQTASPGDTYPVLAGNSILIFCDGNNNVYTGIVSPSSGTLVVSGGGTGATGFGAGGFIKSAGGSAALGAVTTVALGSEVSGILGVPYGGTGGGTWAAGSLIVGNGASNFGSLSGGSAGQVATWNGSTWTAATPSGGVTTVTATAPLAATSGANPVISLSGTVAIANGGTGATTANQALSNLGAPALANTQTWTGANSFNNTLTTYGITPSTNNTYTCGTSNTRWNVVYSSSFAFTANSAWGYNYGTNEAQLAINGQDAGIFTTAAATFPGIVRSSNLSTGYAAIGGNAVTFFNTTTGIYSDGSSMGFQINNVVKMLVNSSGSTFNVTGTYGTISDIRAKENITPARSYLSDLCKLNVVNYNLKDNDTKYLGFIAQDVEKVLPGIVETSPNKEYGIEDFKFLKTSVLIPMLVQSIQELKSNLDSAKAEIAALKAKA